MIKKKERMASFVVRAIKLMSDKNEKEARKTLANGMKYYSNKIIDSFSPYSTADAGLIVFTLKSLAKSIEAKHQGAKALSDELEKITTPPELRTWEKVQKPTTS